MSFGFHFSFFERLDNSAQGHSIRPFDLFQILFQFKCSQCNFALKLIAIAVAKAAHLKLNKSPLNGILKFLQGHRHLDDVERAGTISLDSIAGGIYFAHKDRHRIRRYLLELWDELETI